MTVGIYKIINVENGYVHPMKGLNHTERAKQKIANANSKGLVQQLDHKENIVAIFNNCEEAGRMTNIVSTNIMRVCNGKRKTAGGYKWRRI